MKKPNIKCQISKSQTKIKNFGFCIMILISTFCILHFLTGCGNSGKEKAAEQKEIVPVKVMKVELKSIKNTLDYVGDIKAQDEAIIYPKVNGKVIEKLKEDGSAVNKGDTIAYIDRDEVGFKFEKAPVESPITGIIGRFYCDRGANVTPQTPIALVVDMDKVKIDLNVPEEHLPQVSLGQFAEVSLQPYPNEKFIGEVSKISPVLDSETRTAPVEIIIHNSDHRLKSGMFAQVELVIEEHKGVPVVVKEAIMGKESRFYVYTVNGNTAYQRNIKLGIHQGADYELTDGLREGDLVVVMGQQRLYEGALVTAEIENNKAADIESKGERKQ